MSILYKGIVHPWQCDVMGHLATRHYMAMFDEASYQFLVEATGWKPGHDEWQSHGWTDVHHEIDYKSELLVGTLVEIAGIIEKVGNSSLTICYELRNRISRDSAATMRATSVLFDLHERQSLSLSDSIRSRLDAYQGPTVF